MNEIYDVKTVAKLLGVSVTRAGVMGKEGRFGAKMVFGKYVFDQRLLATEIMHRAKAENLSQALYDICDMVGVVPRELAMVLGLAKGVSRRKGKRAIYEELTANGEAWFVHQLAQVYIKRKFPHELHSALAVQNDYQYRITFWVSDISARTPFFSKLDNDNYDRIVAYFTETVAFIEKMKATKV